VAGTFELTAAEIGVLAHFYRGEVLHRETRLDRLYEWGRRSRRRCAIGNLRQFGGPPLSIVVLTTPGGPIAEGAAFHWRPA